MPKLTGAFTLGEKVQIVDVNIFPVVGDADRSAVLQAGVLPASDNFKCTPMKNMLTMQLMEEKL